MSDQERYSTVAIALHWIIAALVAANIGLAWFWSVQGLHGAAKRPLEHLHISFGVVILLLTLARIGWRLINPPPPLPASTPGWTRRLAQAVHAAFYLAMLALPLSGWLAVSTGSHIATEPIRLFGIIPWPAIWPFTDLAPAGMKLAHHRLEDVHALLAKGLYLLLALHLAGALRRHVSGVRSPHRGMAPAFRRVRAARDDASFT
jgi:cytochrome b561